MQKQTSKTPHTTYNKVNLINGLFINPSLFLHRLCEERKVPSISDRARYRRIIRKAQEEIIHKGYDIGQLSVMC